MSGLLPFFAPPMLLSLGFLVAAAVVLGLHYRDLRRGADSSRPWRLPAAIGLGSLASPVRTAAEAVDMFAIVVAAICLLAIGLSGGRPLISSRPVPLG